MRQRAHVACLLVLCVFATGSEWDLLQIFAWGRMIADHSCSMPLSAAVAKTFDGEMCGICRVLAKVQKQEHSRPSLPEIKIEGKVLFFFQAVPKVIVGEPGSAAWLPSDPQAITELRWSPPVPPPRTAPA